MEKEIREIEKRLNALKSQLEEAAAEEKTAPQTGLPDARSWQAGSPETGPQAKTPSQAKTPPPEKNPPPQKNPPPGASLKGRGRKELYQEFARLQAIDRLGKEWRAAKAALQANRALLQTETDKELLILAQEEQKELLSRREKAEAELIAALRPKDPLDGKNIILELRAGTGGEEAGLFVKDLFEAYSQYALKQNWKMELISLSPGAQGGFKELIALVKGKNVYAALKHESGVHRVQRVPKTESQGRVHTSTVTAVVLPEADPLEVKIRDEDIRIDVQRSGGAGGQHVNTTDSAVRAVHLPTKITVYCQQEKSQRANKEKALKILFARVQAQRREEEEKRRSKTRKNQMKGASRAEKIRTYNFPQSRVTDHRIPLTLKNLPSVMKGDFEKIFNALKALK